MKNKRGISLISVIITVIVLVILASIIVYLGFNESLDTASDTKSAYEADTMLDAVVNRELMHKINPNYYSYIGNNSFGTKTVDGTSYRSDDGWYFISTARELAELGLDNYTEGEYLVNYHNGLAVSVKGLLYQDAVYYSLNDLKQASGGGSTILADIEYDNVKKVNKPVLVAGMVPVKLSGTKWVVTNTEDPAWYDYSSQQKAWANVMLKDELVVTGYTNEQVRSASLSDLEGKEVTTEGSSYVWIPRYTQTSDGSKVIFSELLNDTTGTVNGATYSVPNAFNYENTGSGTIPLPGIWISKYEVSF